MSETEQKAATKWTPTQDQADELAEIVFAWKKDEDDTREYHVLIADWANACQSDRQDLFPLPDGCRPVPGYSALCFDEGGDVITREIAVGRGQVLIHPKTPHRENMTKSMIYWNHHPETIRQAVLYTANQLAKPAGLVVTVKKKGDADA